MVNQNGVVDTNTSEEIKDNTPKRKNETNPSQSIEKEKPGCKTERSSKSNRKKEF